MAAQTFAAVAGATASELLIVRDTVAVDTRAFAATFLMSIPYEHTTVSKGVLEVEKASKMEESSGAAFYVQRR